MLLRLLRNWFIRMRYRSYLKHRPKEWRGNFKTLWEYSLVIKPHLLRSYKPSIGDSVEIITCFDNAEAMLEWIAGILEIIHHLQYFDERPEGMIRYTKKRMTMDDFLVDSGGRIVNIELFCQSLSFGLHDIVEALEHVEDDGWKVMYQRKLFGFFEGIHSVQLGLAEIADKL